MPARAIDPLPERLAIAQIREQFARIEVLLLGACGLVAKEKEQQARLASVPGSELTGDKQR